eukprot:3314064-Rhodomonas_salina.2
MRTIASTLRTESSVAVILHECREDRPSIKGVNKLKRANRGIPGYWRGSKRSGPPLHALILHHLLLFVCSSSLLTDHDPSLNRLPASLSFFLAPSFCHLQERPSDCGSNRRGCWASAP